MSSTHCSSCVMHGNTDSVLHAHISTVLSSLAVQRQSSAPVQRQWRVQSTVEDSAASEEDSEPEELPSRQTDFQSSIRRPETIDSFDVVPQLPELTRSQRVVQQQLIRLFPPVPAADADWGRGPIDSFDYTPQLPAFPKRQHSISAFLQLSIVGRDHHHLPSCGLASVATELLARSLGFPQRNLAAPAFNWIGRLARDNPTIMTDDAATQQAILPATNPRAKKIPLSDFDRTDILCILTPTTPAAYRAVELVAATAGHHILQHPKKHSNLNKTTPADQMEVDSNVKAKPKTKTSLDIALRMSSMIINPAFGFVFGRDNTKSDLLISDGEEINGKQVSGRHFRIYVNPSGSLMCQDTSTNGTYVDSQLLRPQRQPVDHGDKMTLHHGSVIEIQAGPHMESLRFFVQVPDRSGVSMQYGSRLDQYIDFMDQMKRRRQAEQNRREIGLPPDMAPEPLPQFSRSLRGDKLSARANRALVAGTEPYNHGMLWNGGDAYHVTNVLGKGAFATVYKLTRRADGELFAAKEIEKKAFAKGGVLDRRVDQELNIIKQLQHPNIVQYIGHHETAECLYILMELVPHGDLQTVLHTQRTVSEFQCRKVASQMCEALKYLHDRNITHRDIKPDNILIQSNSPCVFKLSDFGLSKVVEDHTTFLKSFCGTYLYCAPEVYPGYHQYANENRRPEPIGRRAKRTSKAKPKQPYTTAVDTWSLAAVLYHLLCGNPPFTGTVEDFGAGILDCMMNKAVDYVRLFDAGVSKDAIDFVGKMLIIDPSLRMSDTDCLKHPFIVADKKAKESEESADLDLQTQAAARPTDQTTRDDTRTEEYSLSKFEQLASQLSIKNHGNEEDSLAFDELSSEYLEDIEGMVGAMGQPKIGGQAKQVLQDVSDPSFEEYVDQYPSSSQIQAAQQHPGNNLFGQINPAALRSSGALGREARRALEIASQGRGGSSADESHYAGASQISVTDYPNPQSHPPPPDPYENTGSGEAAPSLLGAEYLVDKLTMDSTMADVSVLDSSKRALGPEVNERDDNVPQTRADKHPSTYSDDDDLYSATPQRSRRRLDEPSPSLRESKRVKVQHEEPKARIVDSQMKEAEAITASRTAVIPAVDQVAKDQGTASSEQDPRDIAPAVSTRQNVSQQAQPSAGQPPNSTPSSSTTKADSIAAPSAINPPTSNPPISSPLAPPPPGPINYGTLSPTPDSLPFPTITLNQRITTFGRHPACDFRWPNALDTRVPKFAFDVVFWRRGLERALTKHPTHPWHKDKELQAIIHTRTSAAIFVNGVKLTRAQETGKVNYGVLRTGDVVTVFQGQGKDCLKFKVEVRIGRSKGKRKEEEVFEVVKEDEKEKAGSSHESGSRGHEGSGYGDGETDSALPAPATS